MRALGYVTVIEMVAAELIRGVGGQGAAGRTTVHRDEEDVTRAVPGL